MKNKNNTALTIWIMLTALNIRNFIKFQIIGQSASTDIWNFMIPYMLTFIPMIVCAIIIMQKHIKYIEKMLLKLLVIILIWGLTFMPFTIQILSLPRLPIEMYQTRKEIRSYDTYLDLSEFSLGVYKGPDRDRYIYDITRPKKDYGKVNFVMQVYEKAYNRDSLRDSFFGGEKYNMYDTYFYNDFYIVVPENVALEPDPSSFSSALAMAGGRKPQEIKKRFYIAFYKIKTREIYERIFEKEEDLENLNKLKQQLKGEKKTRNELLQMLGRTD